MNYNYIYKNYNVIYQNYILTQANVISNPEEISIYKYCKYILHVTNYT